ncbi:hypothetical protein A2U01_0030161, partial [Trifolium medium]|nr:hypothetical protein [Trifolium medium]
MTSFEALYGRKPPTFVHYTSGTSKIESLDELLTQKTQILKVLKDNLVKARNRMIIQVNRHRQNRNFEIGKVAYELDLPATSRVHPVFHVSLLKLCYGEPTTQVAPIADPSSYLQIEPIPIAIRNRRVSSEGVEEFLVEWKDLPPSEATWVAKTTFQNQFSNINLEDKILFDDVGNVTQQ